MTNANDVAQSVGLLQNGLPHADLAQWSKIESEAMLALTEAVERQEKELADKLWYLHKLASSRRKFFECFKKNKKWLLL